MTELKIRIGNSMYETSRNRGNQGIAGQMDLNRLLDEIVFFNGQTLFYSVPALNRPYVS